MTARPLIVTGTPFAAWLAQPPFGGTADPRPATAALAAWHDDALGTGAQRLGALASGQPLALNAAQRQALHALPMGERGQTFVVEPRACWTLPELAKAWPDAHFVLVAEHPLAALSTWLRRADVEDEDPWAALDLWVGGAGRLWAHARAHPGRCTLVDAAELRRAPRAWIDRCRRDWGIDWPDTPAAGDDGPDPLSWALGEALVLDRPDVRQLWEELHAATTPFDPGADAVASLAWVARVDARAASDRYRALRQAAGRHGELAQAKGENQRLLLRMHQLQAELEHHFAAAGALESGLRAPRAAFDRLEVAAVTFGASQERPPHRQLDMSLQQVAYGARRLERLDLRLVHHVGRPGVLLFDTGALPRALSAWQASGQENGRDFLLLVPQDEQAAGRLATLGTTDWAFVVDLVGRIEHELAQADETLRRPWLAVARQLAAQLRHAPMRLRYDGVEVGAAADGAARGLAVTFRRVLAGDRACEQLHLDWWVHGVPAGEGRGAEIELRDDPQRDGAPLLDAWPVDGDGCRVERMALPLGGSGAGPGWAALGDADKAFVWALLDALPAAAGAAPADLVPTGLGKQGLARAARDKRRQASRALQGSPVRKAIRAVKRRLVG